MSVLKRRNYNKVRLNNIMLSFDDVINFVSINEINRRECNLSSSKIELSTYTNKYIIEIQLFESTLQLLLNY